MKKRILSTLLALCMLLALLPGTALAADSGTIGGLTWKVSGGVLTISGKGGMYNFAGNTIPWSEHLNSISKVVIEDGVTSIGSWAFYTCAMTNVVIPNSVTSIGNDAFNDCKNLTSVTIPNGVTVIKESTFDLCRNLTRVTIPNSVTKIEKRAFADCNKLAQITIPNGVTLIGDEAFRYCSSLTSLTIPNSVTTIEHGAFYGCQKVTRLTIPNSVTELGDHAFANLGSLTNLTVPGSIKKISSQAFGYCDKLTSVTIEEGITEIGFFAFGGSPITTINIPNSVTTIVRNAFAGCEKLKDVYYAGTKAQWEKIAIDNSNGYNSDLLNAKIHYNGSSSGFMVTFNANGGSGSTTKTYAANATLGSLPTPTRSGYKFSGWYTSASGGTKASSSTKVTKDMTLYARWTKNPTTATYTITLNANSGTVSPSSIKVESGKTYLSSLPTPTRKGYKFDGWYTSRTGGTKITSTAKATANRTIYAHWTRAKMYTVTFDANGGMIEQDQKLVRTGSLYGELPTPVKSNSHFKGWYTKKTGGTKVTEKTRANLTANQTLYAQWQTSASVRSTQRGTYRITVPSYYELSLYTSSSTAKIASQAEMTGYQTITCTQKATLSNGTVRYYGKVNNQNYWFTYSCEMDVD